MNPLDFIGQIGKGVTLLLAEGRLFTFLVEHPATWITFLALVGIVGILLDLGPLKRIEPRSLVRAVLTITLCVLALGGAGAIAISAAGNALERHASEQRAPAATTHHAKPDFHAPVAPAPRPEAGGSD